MQRTHSLSQMRKYQCDSNCCADFIDMTKLLVSWYHRFDISNLFNLNSWRIHFANEILFANFEFWVFYTRSLLNIEVSWDNKDALLQRFLSLCVWCIRIDLKKHYNRDFRIDILNFETWRSIVIVIFAFEIISIFFSIYYQFALKIWKRLLEWFKKSMIWWFRCLLFSISRVWFRTIHNLRFDDWQLIEWQKVRIWVFLLFSIFLLLLEIDELLERKENFKREKRHSRDRMKYIRFRKSSRFFYTSSHIHIHNI